MSEDDLAHGEGPLPQVDGAPMHAAVNELAEALHAYVEHAIGVRAEFGAGEADEDPRVLSLQTRIGSLNAHLFDTVHASLGMHPELTASVWHTDDRPPLDEPEAEAATELAGVFYLGFVITQPPVVRDLDLHGALAFLDAAGAQVVGQLTDAGLGVAEWAASQGEPATFDGFGFQESQ